MMTGPGSGRKWLVLLIGGPSGIGKTTVAAQIARRLDVPWLMVDDLRLALMRSGLPIPDNPHAEALDPAEGLVAIGEAVTPAIEVVIENHVDQRLPIVIEGDGILPSLFERDSVPARATSGRVRTVYLTEPEPDALHANLVARRRRLARRPALVRAPERRVWGVAQDGGGASRPAGRARPPSGHARRPHPRRGRVPVTVLLPLRRARSRTGDRYAGQTPDRSSLCAAVR